MAKFYGEIGYIETVETEPGIFEEKVIKRNYSGDLLRNSRRLQTTDQVNDNITISNELSIVADPYAYDHFHNMRYAKLNGTAWKITNVEEHYPRLILTLGGIYHG